MLWFHKLVYCVFVGLCVSVFHMLYLVFIYFACFLKRKKGVELDGLVVIGGRGRGNQKEIDRHTERNKDRQIEG